MTLCFLLGASLLFTSSEPETRTAEHVFGASVKKLIFASICDPFVFKGFLGHHIMAVAIAMYV